MKRQDMIKMNFDFIEDTNNYAFDHSKDQFVPIDKAINPVTDAPEGALENHHVDINNHPLIIMANGKKADLLQHPVCLVITERKWDMYGLKAYSLLIGVYVVFLAAFNAFILTSASPIDSQEKFNCTEFFGNIQKNETGTAGNVEDKRKEDLNQIFRIIVLVLNVARVVFFFWYGEFCLLWNQVKKIQWRQLKLPFIFLFDVLIYSLAFFLASYDLLWEPSCFQWQLGAVTIAMAWINLLLHMRLLNKIGIYIIIFEDVIYTFLKIAVVFVILLVGFALSFHILLSHRQEFTYPYDALLRTVIMMSGKMFSTVIPPRKIKNVISGEIEYGNIFFKDKPPLDFGDKWDQDWEQVPFPFVTYTMFIAFVIAVTFLAFNVLVGLTVDDIRNFLGNADLRKLCMRLEFIRQMEQVGILGCWGKRVLVDKTITKKTSFEVMIWKDIEKRKIKSRKKGKIEDELSKMQSKIKELKEMNTNTNKLVAEVRMSMAEINSNTNNLVAEIRSSMAEIKSSLQESKLSG